MKRLNVEPQIRTGVQADAFSVGVQPGRLSRSGQWVGESLPEGIEGAAEGGPRVALVGFGPEQGGERVAPMSLARDGQVGQQGDGLARVHLDRHAVALDAGRAQQVYMQVRHGDVSLARVFRVQCRPLIEGTLRVCMLLASFCSEGVQAGLGNARQGQWPM